MKTKIDELLGNNPILHSKILLDLLSELNKLEFDPISIELTIDRLNSANKYNFNEVESYILHLCSVFNTLNYDSKYHLLRMLPHDYESLVDYLNSNQSHLEDIAYDSKFKVNNFDISIAESNENLVNILRDMYQNAPQGYQMTMVHLFGIKYSSQLENVSTKDIAVKATGKDSLWVEIGKGMKLSKFVQPIPTDSELNASSSNISQDSKESIGKMSYDIFYDTNDILVMDKYNLVIKSNERNYLYKFRDRKVNWINSGGTPTFFKCLDFEWNGSSWKSLMTDFTEWIIDKLGYLDDGFINIKSSWSKQMVFSRDKKTNYLGPFKYDLYINGNHTALHMWWQILDLVELLPNDEKIDTYVLVHYPSALEPREISKMIWKKEIISYKQFLLDRDFSNDQIHHAIESVKRINVIYKNDTPNYYFSNIDRKQDMSNALSRMKRMDVYLKESHQLGTYLDLFVDFKKQLKYSDYSCC